LKEIEEILSEFNFLEDWEDKYQHLIDLGKHLEPLDEKYKNEKYKLKGCQSTVYFVTKDNSDGTISFFANSDAFIVQGLIALLLKVYSNKTAECILETNISFLSEIGLESHLSPTRKNGLSAMLNKIKSEANLRINK
tara:strand:+ start:283 stop:693 length:411 start_codon:yes stop_codon:yes gene_type:complete